MEGASHQEIMKIIHEEVDRERKKYYDRKRVESHPLERGERVYLWRKTIGSKRDSIGTKRN
jgi:hypothetical protein